MSKLILAAMGFMMGLGSITGYFLAKWDIQSNGFPDRQNAIAATTAPAKEISLKPAPIPPRADLELKYALCTNSAPDKKTLNRFSDKQLNDLVFKVCSENS
ncbi:hypothetical protein [Pseudanabaena sp. 'Roaring Creek']|uniref:hypothetical protein n=1 Tax=Pseudanabaena sp. 'Roaring Creek' TaxID=1681830 RepID=UPI0006D7BC18|nr:hypothetical protein [Pseudanabaena sp. 'Roaring Creek']